MRVLFSPALCAEDGFAKIARIKEELSAMSEAELAALRKTSVGSKSASGVKVTFTIKDFGDYHFYALHEEPTLRAKFEHLNTMSTKLEYKHLVKMKIGNDSFRDKVELNSIIRDKNRQPKFFELAPRVGYTLCTIIF